MSDVAIRVEGLGKRYRIGEHEQYSALRDLPGKLLGAPLRRWRQRASRPEREEIWALRNVDLEIKAGEVVGVIGRNGAGKSTLLKILSRITEPTEGMAEIHGTVGSLLEVGTGFHPELTGRENVYLNGAILGMRRAEIARQFDQIVDFAGVERFIDTPVKHYSSGMQMRLAIAVAAHLQPEILLIDEVLAVGDAEFQRKCLGKMGEVAGQGRTVLFVSHNLGAMTRLCPGALWMEGGRVAMVGATDAVIAAYLGSNAALSGSRCWESGFANPGVDEFRLYSVRVLDEELQETSSIDIRKDFFIEIAYRVLRELPYLRIGFLLVSGDGTEVFDAYDSDNPDLHGARPVGKSLMRCRVPGRLLQPGAYSLTVTAGLPLIKNFVYLENAVSFEVEATESIGLTIEMGRRGVIRPCLSWQQVECSRG